MAENENKKGFEKISVNSFSFDCFRFCFSKIVGME
jgi:hypothetical protein